MLMSDVIKVLGDTPLKAFPWGCVVRDTVNLFVMDTNRLTENSTGMDVTAALESLPLETRDLVLQAKLDPGRRCMDTPVGGGLVLRNEEEETLPTAVMDDTAALRRALLSPQFLMIAFMVVIPLTMCTIMISNLSIHKDFSWAEVGAALFKMFGLSIFGG